MKILFCQGSQRLKDGSLLKVKKMTIPGLTLPYLAAIVGKGHEVILQNEMLEELDFDGDYDLVGITTMGGSINRSLEIADEFKKRGKTVIMGGVPITNLPEVAIGRCDAIVRGEAELVWEKLVEDLQKGQLQEVYEAEDFCDLKTIPTPRYELLDMKNYSSVLPVQATRGCSQTCSFCSLTPIYRGKFRIRTPEDVIEDIKLVKKMGYKRMLFVDDNIVANKKFARQLFKMMIPLKMQWFGQASLTSLGDEEFVELMAKSGCSMLSIGFETIDQKALKSINKKANVVEKYEEKIKVLKKFGIHINAFLIFGFDEHDSSIFDTTYNYFMKIGVSLPELFILVPPPGTPVFKEFNEAGRLLHKDWDNYKVSEVVFQPSQMSPEELSEGYWRTYDRFYSIPSIIKRMFRRRTRGILFNIYMLKVNLNYRRVVRKERRHPSLV
ncbi:MAG: B12-binding domain-containing radical SAM protein [Spirochaetota bacterium]|nr:B12-binding domain-containing radical SAM protein [Spirochaetota bacterium]